MTVGSSWTHPGPGECTEGNSRKQGNINNQNELEADLTVGFCVSRRNKQWPSMVVCKLLTR